MAKVRIDQVWGPSAGQFFKLRRPLSANFVDTLFKEVVKEHADGAPVARDVRMTRRLNSTPYIYSFICFPVRNEPGFLEGTSLEEIRYSFLLLIEHESYLGVFRRLVGDVESYHKQFSRYCMGLGRKELTRVFAGKAKYEKLSTNRMSMSRHELRATSYEADDLETTIPTQSAARSIPKFLRLRHPDAGKVSITPGTSRIHKSGEKLPVDDLALLVSEIRREVEAGNASAFLDAFAIPIELRDLPPTVNPTGIFLDLSGLIEVGEDGTTHKAQLCGPNDGRVDVTTQLCKRFDQVLPLQVIGTDCVISDDGRALGMVRRNDKSLSVRLNITYPLVISSNDGKEARFHSWLKENQAFSICFSSPEFFYANGHLYQCASFDREVALVRSILQPHAGLSTVTSEKGDTQSYGGTTSAFDHQSIFAIVETQLASGAEHIWCCDLGDEWADYITLDTNANVLRFYHCKHGDNTAGASDYQVVVAQALKNLGRVQVSETALLQKIASAENRATWGSSGINLLRKTGDTWPALHTHAQTFVRNAFGAREVYLVLSMLSQTSFDAENAKSTKEPHFLQLVWLLSSFMSSCREKGARPYIVCKP